MDTLIGIYLSFICENKFHFQRKFLSEIFA